MKSQRRSIGGENRRNVGEKMRDTCVVIIIIIIMRRRKRGAAGRSGRVPGGWQMGARKWTGGVGAWQGGGGFDRGGGTGRLGER